jgi:hypothetical protein
MGAHIGHMLLRLADDAQIHREEPSDYGPLAILKGWDWGHPNPEKMLFIIIGTMHGESSTMTAKKNFSCSWLGYALFKLVEIIGTPNEATPSHTTPNLVS